MTSFAYLLYTTIIFPGLKYDLKDSEGARYMDIVADSFRNLGGPMKLLNFFPYLNWILPKFIKNTFMQVEKTRQQMEEFFNYMMVILKSSYPMLRQ